MKLKIKSKDYVQFRSIKKSITFKMLKNGKLEISKDFTCQKPIQLQSGLKVDKCICRSFQLQHNWLLPLFDENQMQLNW